MLKIFKFLFYIIITVGTIILVLAFTSTNLFENKLKSILISGINSSIEGNFEAKEFKLSFLNFPNPRARFSKVLLSDDTGKKLIDADIMDFEVSLFSVFGKNPIIKSITIKDGIINIIRDKKGNINLDIGKKGENDNNTDFKLSLVEAKIINTQVNYSDQGIALKTEILFEDGLFSGEFKSSEFILYSIASTRIKSILDKGKTIMSDKAFSYTANKIYVNLNEHKFEFKDIELSLENLLLFADGNIISKREYSEFDVVFTGKKSKLEDIIPILPKEFAKHFEGLESKGNIEISGDIEGMLGAKNKPVINIDMDFSNGSIILPYMLSPLEDINFSAHLGNKKDVFNFSLPGFTCTWKKEDLSLNLKVIDIFGSNPNMNALVNGNLPLYNTLDFISFSNIESANGIILFKNIEINGNANSFKGEELIKSINASGKLEFEDVMLQTTDEIIKIKDGNLVFNNDKISVNAVHASAKNTDLLISGVITDFLPFIFKDSTNTSSNLGIIANIDADKLDLNEILSLNLKSDQSNTEELDYRKMISGANGKLELKIGKFTYGKLNGENFIGDIDFENNTIGISGEIDAMDGIYNIESDIVFEEELKMKLFLSGEDINATKLFNSFDNFGQETLTSKNISGDITSYSVVDIVWNNKGQLNYDDIVAYIYMNIKDGELNNFELLNPLKKWIDEGDLNNIKFSELENWLKVKDNRIEIPFMNIKSSAFNMDLSGWHKFDNKMDYNFKVNAFNILTKKLLHKKDALDKERKHGFLHIYMAGDVEDFEIKRNKPRVSAKFKSSAYKKQKIKRMLEEQFNLQISSKVEEMAESMEEEIEEMEEVQKENSEPGNDENKPKINEFGDEEIEFEE